MGKKLGIGVMAFVVSWLILFCFLNAGLFESVDEVAVSNAANCTKLSGADCAKVGACVVGESSCILDPCYERLLPTQSCKSNAGGKPCGRVKWDDATDTYFCVSEDRVASFATNASVCSLEWGEYQATTWAACQTVSNCGQLTSINTTGAESEKYYICAPGAAASDPCNGLNATSCAYVHDCMLSNEVCVHDACWERTIPGVGNCDAGCGQGSDNKPYPLTTGSGGYCKSATSPLNNVCNAISGSFELTTKGYCAAFLPSSGKCTGIITVTNYGGDTLYVCNTEDLEIDAHAVSLNSLVVASLSLILLILML